jgi:rhomboid protease GluP
LQKQKKCNNFGLPDNNFYMAAWKTIIEEPALNADEYLLVAAKTVSDLGWDIHFISDHGLIAGIPLSLKSNSWGETFTIWLNHGQVYLESKSNGMVIGSKKNQQQVMQYLSHFEESHVRMTGEEKDRLQQWVTEKKTSGEEDVLDPLSSNYRDPSIIEKWYLPRGEFGVTATLIGFCVVLFILMVMSGANIFSPSMEVLIKWGANARSLTVVGGEWWRIFTCIFEHIGVIHLLVNMISLYMIGTLLEPLIGKWRFLTAFIVTGIGGSIASIVWNPNVASAGASGAIFGLFGLTLALLSTNLIEKNIRNSIFPNIISVVVINLVAGFRPGVDYAAHIGGLITGLILGYLYFLLIRKTRQPIFFSIIASAVIGIVIIAAGFKSLDNIHTDFERVLQGASKYEEQGLKVFKDMEKAGDLRVIKYITDETIPAWESYQKELTKLDALKLPPDLQKTKEELKQYGNLRLKFFELMRKAMKEDTQEYNYELEEYNRQILAILEKLNKEN